ncbi:hypothetical protein BDV93DRAFT_526757 [Ceratobasidium sp. AG-I]|nr:hypothetical protein BDV93DRAFT_526757 [Ceratobasidium sp. AG-I]
MASTIKPKAIMVMFYRQSSDPKSFEAILARSTTECRVHQSHPPNISSSFVTRIFKQNDSYQPQIKAAHRFVVENYRPGDHVMLFGWVDYWNAGGPRYEAIRQLAAALAENTRTETSGSKRFSGEIPIKCVYLQFMAGQALQWSLVDQALSDLPSTVENLLCIDFNSAYMVERGLHRQIVRKEAWLSTGDIWQAQVAWFVLQTSRFIKYNSRDLVFSNNSSGLLGKLDQPKLLRATTSSNYSKRLRGIPCEDAIPTGGQLTRVSEVTGYARSGYGSTVTYTYECLVWSYRYFAEGERNDVRNAPLVGP